MSENLSFRFIYIYNPQGQNKKKQKWWFTTHTISPMRVIKYLNQEISRYY